MIDWRTPIESALNMLKEASVKTCYIEASLFKKFDIEHCENVVFLPYFSQISLAELLPCHI